jgi:hypothetical protein
MADTYFKDTADVAYYDTVDVDWMEEVTGKISRYHDLSGLGGMGQTTFNPLE